MRRQRPNVERMRLLGAEVRPVEFGMRALKEATSEAIRDWITNVETTHYLIGSAVGPHPYPAIVRELQAVIGREARAQFLDAEERLRGGRRRMRRRWSCCRVLVRRIAVRQADVLAGVPETDHWVVMGRSDAREDRIEVRRIWLRGADSGEWAMLLSFAAFQQSFDTSLCRRHAGACRPLPLPRCGARCGCWWGRATAIRRRAWQLVGSSIAEACAQIGRGARRGTMARAVSGLCVLPRRLARKAAGY